MRWAISAFCALLAGAAWAQGEIAILHPAADAYAGRMAAHVKRWYAKEGVAADIVTDAAPDAALAGRRLAHLIMVSHPTAGQLAAFKRFRARGGKFVVFYSTSDKLADLMGVQLGAYRKPDAAYRAFAFEKTAAPPAGAPTLVEQSSANIYTAFPVKGRSRVVAWWQDAARRRTSDPAWLASGAGWWMTHVLLPSGDESAKAQLLCALAGAAVPGSWNAAAFQARKQAAAQADRAYAAAQKSRRGEIHGVWDQSGEGLYPGDWPRTMRVLASAGITDLFLNVGGAGFAHYNSKVLPPSPVLTKSGDQLRSALAAAHVLGIRVHAWLICFNATHATPARLANFAKRGWRVKDAKTGALTEYLDPSRADLRDYLIAAAGEIAGHYPVDGVHLDFVRWYENAARPAPRPTAPITEFVARARAGVRRARPQAIVSTAVFGKYPSCVASVGQDWESWIDAGLVDWIVPMNYTEDAAKYASFVARQGRTPAHARKVISGIGVTSYEARLTPRQVINQILMARRANLAGVCFFDLDYTLVNDILPYLRLGVFAPMK